MAIKHFPVVRFTSRGREYEVDERLITTIHPLFSAIWRMICASFNSSSSSKTNSINSCSGPFLHLAAGGLRTSVTRGLPQ